MKNTILLFALSLITLVQIHAQNTLALVDNNVTFENTEMTSSTADKTKAAIAKFEKVEKAVVRKLQAQVTYPERAYEYGVEGTVLVQFTFDGNVSEAKVVKSVGAGCDEAALKAVQNFSKFYQEIDGENIKPIQVTVPFVFEM